MLAHLKGIIKYLGDSPTYRWVLCPTFNLIFNFQWKAEAMQSRPFSSLNLCYSLLTCGNAINDEKKFTSSAWLSINTIRSKSFSSWNLFHEYSDKSWKCFSSSARQDHEKESQFQQCPRLQCTQLVKRKIKKQICEFIEIFTVCMMAVSQRSYIEGKTEKS